MIPRNNLREILLNDKPMYEKVFYDRGVKFIKQFETLEFNKIRPEDIKNLTLIEHYWAVGDRMYKLANKHYGDSRDWWIIAQFNNKPTDSHIQIGDRILIPKPIEKIIKILRG